MGMAKKNILLHHHHTSVHMTAVFVPKKKKTKIGSIFSSNEEVIAVTQE
jgi:hypothetical protein